MTFSKENAKAKKVWFDKDNLWLLLIDGRQLSIPLSYFPSLKGAPESKLNEYELSGEGIGIHWDSLDEDLYVPNLLMTAYSSTEEQHIA